MQQNSSLRFHGIMDIHLLFMLIGDILLVIIMGFYAGVGIWESGTVRHILGMLMPAVAVWLIAAAIFRLYNSFPQDLNGFRWKQAPQLADRLIAWQKPWKLLAVWAVTAIFACLWQAFYWRHILQSQTYFYRFGFHTLAWYLSSYAVFFVLWRFFWTNFTVLSVLAKEYKWIKIVCNTVGIVLLIYFSAALIINFHYRNYKYSVDTLPDNAPRTALVFGAGIYLNGQPSAVLVDRVNTAIELYQKGKIDEMIMSGDNSDFSRNEVDHMVSLALEAGVPAEAILRDDNGVHTAESCWNAVNVFGKKEVIFVSQDFHAVRIMMTAKSYGLTGVTVTADRRVYNIFSWALWYIMDWIRLPIYWLHYN